MSKNLLANLTSIYYENLNNALDNPTGFQMVTGSTQVSDQTTVNVVADGIPLVSLNNSFSGNPINTYSSNYGNIINELVAPSYVSNALGTQYADAWYSYQKTNSSQLDFTSTAKLLASKKVLMQKWGVEDDIPDGTVQAGITALTQEVDNAVAVAVDLWHSNASNSYGFYPKYPDIPTKFNNARPCSFSITSIQEEADLSKTWAEGEFAILADIFELGNETSYSSESQRFIGSGFTLDFKCDQVSFEVIPVKVGQDFNIASTKYGAWFSNAALQLAYKSPNDATVWTRAADWEKFFGENGTFSRVVTKFFLAQNINMTMSSTATFSSEEVTKLQTAAEGGFWPFFVAKAHGGYDSTVTHNDDKSITVKTTSPIGVYILLGVATDSLSNLLK